MKLGNRRCQCSGCLEYFNSTGAFDKHRTGAYATPGQWQGNRRCRSIEEMTAMGMEKNAPGFWITSKRPSLPAQEGHARADRGRGSANPDGGSSALRQSQEGI